MMHTRMLRNWRFRPIIPCAVISSPSTSSRCCSVAPRDMEKRQAMTPLLERTPSRCMTRRRRDHVTEDGRAQQRRRHSGGPRGQRHATPVPIAAFLGFLFASTSEKDDSGGSSSGTSTADLSPLEKLLHEADRLDAAMEFRQEYDLLEELEGEGNAEILWRLVRATVRGFELSLLGVTQQQYVSLMRLTRRRAERAVQAAPDCKNCLLWCGVAGYLNFNHIHSKERVREFSKVKQKLMRAVELDSADPIAWYWLGRWHFEAADEPCFRSITELLVSDHPPPSTFYDALICFHQAELLSPGFRMDNLWQLARTYVRLLDYDKAYTLLWQVVSAKAFTDAERASRDYAKRYLRAYFNEDIHDKYDMPVEFYAKLCAGNIQYYDRASEEELRKKEELIRKDLKEKEPKS